MDQGDEENTSLGLSLAIEAHKPSSCSKTTSSHLCTSPAPNNIKRGKSIETYEHADIQNDILILDGEEELEEHNFCKKKLRLSTEQHSILESTFREHSTLNPKQKQTLAKELNLLPRQVEVWFQNRRARIKLKQTEANCEFMRRCYEALIEENKRMQKELHELRALKAMQKQPIYYMQSPAATLTMCPSCKQIFTVSFGSNSVSRSEPEPSTSLGLYRVLPTNKPPLF
ncbi:Homeobox associated leucine zipper protein [Rhynchospora pubera]|uniref:Homeobox associated leucine zipper protein n=1 Tax=Rhynchospora pubera TaxID=906938 RepID=A0AAV8FCH2_9POAL|nr:Homeobox associated leucine zipper protein [Rhynchospora pubera]